MPHKFLIRFNFECDINVNGLNGVDVTNFLEGETLLVEYIQSAESPEYAHIYIGNFQCILDIPASFFTVEREIVV